MLPFQPLLTCGPEEQRASGENCCTKAVGKRSKLVDEDEIVPKSLKLTDESKVRFKTTDFVIKNN